MSSGDSVEGKVVKNLPNQLFEVELGSGSRVRVHLAEEMKLKFTRLLPGQRVRVEVSSFDSSRGRIIARID